MICSNEFQVVSHRRLGETAFYFRLYGYLIILLLGVGVGYLHDFQQLLREQNEKIREQRQYFESFFATALSQL